jgi:hypothetical protein
LDSKTDPWAAFKPQAPATDKTDPWAAFKPQAPATDKTDPWAAFKPQGKPAEGGGLVDDIKSAYASLPSAKQVGAEVADTLEPITDIPRQMAEGYQQGQDYSRAHSDIPSKLLGQAGSVAGALTPLVTGPLGAMGRAFEKTGGFIGAENPAAWEKPGVPSKDASATTIPAAETPQPAAPAEAPPATGSGSVNLSGMGKSMTSNLYEGLFKSLQSGKNTFAGVKDKVLTDAKPAYDAGLIKSPEDLADFVNGHSRFSQRPAVGAEQAPKATGPVTREDVNAIDLSHYQREGAHQSNLQQANEFLQGAVKEHPELKDPNTVNALLAKSQGDTSVPLTPAQEALHEKLIVPLQEKVYDLYNQRVAMARQEGGYSNDDIEAMKAEFDKNYMPRIPERYADRQLNLDQQEAMDPISGRRGRGMTRKSDDMSLNQRVYHAIEAPNGERAVVRMNPKTKNFTLVRPENDRDRAIFEGSYDTKTARIGEIEEATKDLPTPEKYIKDPLVAYKLAEIHLERSIREMADTKALKAEMMERGWAGGENVGKSKGWRTTEFPGMQGTYVEPRLAAALDRWGGIDTSKVGLIDQAVAANQFLTRTMFGIPIPHILNVGVGFLSDIHLSSPKNFLKAVQDMQGRNDGFYRKVLEHGGALWTSSDKAAQAYTTMEDMVRLMSGEEKPAPSLAGKAAAPVAAWWKASHDAMGYAQDLMMLTQVRDYMQSGPLHKAMGLDDAIRQAHKAVPPYRIPTEVPHPEMGELAAKISRAPSAFTEDKLGKLVNNFARYHYFTIQQSMKPLEAAFKAAQATQRAVGGDKAGAAKSAFEAQRALKQAVLLGLGLSIAMPWIDEKFKEMTGDQRAMMTRHGAMAVMQAATDVVRGTVTPWAAASLIGQSLTPLASMFADWATHTEGKIRNSGRKAQQVGSTAETNGQLIGKLLKDIPIFGQLEGFLPEKTREQVEGQKPKPKNWAETLLPLGPGLTHEPYSTKPRPRKPH